MPFDKQPTLEGAHVRARPLRASDFESLFAVASDPLIWEQHPAPNRYQEREFRKFFEESLDSAGALLVTDLGTDQVIGSTRFHGYSEVRSEVEIGWTFLARSHWGGTYNRDLKSIMTEHAFRFVTTVILLIGESNLRSQRAAVKIGAVADQGSDARGRLTFRLTRPGG